MAVTAGAAVMLAGIVVIDRDHSGGVGLSALPGATGQPAPTGPTGGGSGGGMGGPPFPLQPPDMPSGPPNGYNSGAYPAPDQGNGISIYNSDAPQSPGSQDGYQQAPNYPQQLQPANGTQPPNYDAPLQTAQPQQAPQHPAQNQPNEQQPQQNSQQQRPTTVTMTVTASSEPATSPAPSPTASAPPGNDNGSSNNGQQNSDTKHENTDDRSDKCPGNVAPMYANDNVDPTETKPMTVKDFSPFAEFGNLINNGFDQHELTFQIANGTPDRFAKAFREAVKRWNDAQKKIAVHEVGPTSWYDFVGPSLTFNVLDSDPPKASDGGGYFPAETSLREERISAWSKGFAHISDEKLVGAMAHEIGHALGLDHSCKGALMYYQIGTWQATSPTPLDVAIFNMIPR
jgi:hypothetical protein